MQVLGWDEAFVGIETDDPEQVARAAQASVLDATGLHCSVGIGDTTVRAKIATEFGKPRGTFRLTRENWYAVMGDLPTQDLWGIGSRISQRLAALGIQTVRQLAETADEPLVAEFGPNTGPHIGRLGRGVSTNRVDDTPWVARAHGRETTYQHNLVTADEIDAAVRTLAEQVSRTSAPRGAPACGCTSRCGSRRSSPSPARASSPGPTYDAAVIADTALDLLAGSTTSARSACSAYAPRWCRPRVGTTHRGPTGGAATRERPPDRELAGQHEVVQQQPDRRGGREQRVEPVHQAAVARDHLAHVLDAEVALDHRLAQVAERGHHHRDQPEQRRPPTRRRRSSTTTRTTPATTQVSADPAKPSHDFFGEITGAIGCLPNSTPAAYPPMSEAMVTTMKVTIALTPVVLTEHERHERAEERHVDQREDGGGRVLHVAGHARRSSHSIVTSAVTAVAVTSAVGALEVGAGRPSRRRRSSAAPGGCRCRAP